MRSKSPQKSTLSLSFLYLKEKGKKSGDVKKVFMPNSLATLLKKAQQLFIDKFEVKTLFTDGGKIITRYEQIIPGSTIYVSPNDANGERSSPLKTVTPSPRKKKKVMSESSYNRLFITPDKLSSTASSVIGEDQNEGNSQFVTPTKGSGRRRSQMSDDDFYSPNKKNMTNATIRDAASMIPTPRKNVLESTSESEMGDTPRKRTSLVPTPKSSSKRKHTGQKRKIQEQHFTELSDTDDSDNSDVDKNEVEENTIVSNVEESSLEKLHGLFHILLGENDMYKKLKKYQFTDDKDFLLQCPNENDDQATYWYIKGKEFAESQGINFGNNADEISKKAREIITNHRFRNGYRLNLGITGPSDTGKSIFLATVVDELLINLVTTGMYKKYFMVFLNSETINVVAQSPADLFRYMVDLSIKALQWHRPNYMKYAAMIQKFLYPIVEIYQVGKLENDFVINKEFQMFAQNLSRLGQDLVEIWCTDIALLEWHRICFLLPNLISEAAGLHEVIYVVDHFDDCDVSASPMQPFTNSPRTSFIIDHLKFTFSNTNYIVGSKDHKRFLSALYPLSESEYGGLDFSTSIELYTTLDLVDPSDYTKSQICVTVEGETDPYILTIEHFGGAPAYLLKWTEINQAFDEFESAEEDSEEKEEMKILLVHLATQILEELFIIHNDDDSYAALEDVDVKTIKRVSKE